MRVFRKNSGFSLLKCQVQPMRGLHILRYIYADLPSPETRIFFDTSNPATLSPEVSATPHPSVAFLSTDFDEFLAERRQILSDARALRHLAIAFLHPELPVVTSDAAARARCYFNRASAFEQESVEESEVRTQILADAAALKMHAIMYAHPELPVVTSDATSTARCYFDRASAFEQESVEESEERAQILADSAALKERAIMYAHPELPVVTSDATSTARCYFDRASAFEQESVEESEERAQILADSAALKERAIMYAHPELPVVTSDATATARCYFDRASATYDEEIVSTHAYSKAEKKEERLETTLQSLEALVESTGIKAPAASGPEARMPRSASNVQLFDLQDTA